MSWQKNWPASRQENGFFEVWPVGLIFPIFTNGDCICYYEEKTKIIARATRANHNTTASLKTKVAIYRLGGGGGGGVGGFWAKHGEIWPIPPLNAIPLK